MHCDKLRKKIIIIYLMIIVDYESNYNSFNVEKFI